ncbi:T3SS (YopN, CesT) and YbjN peptide-binding chaperone 1 [Geodermatophilus sp. SYSU D00804]
MSPEVYEAVNTINSSVAMAKAMVTGDGRTILLSAELLVDTLSPSEFMFAVDMVSNAADHFDTLLQKRFGGHTLLKDDYSDSTDV